MRSVAVLTFGAEAEPIGERWLSARGGPIWRCHVPAGSPAGPAALADEVAAATVGWRLFVAGPEADVLAAYAVATAGGAVATEITTFVTERRRRRVRCVHCAAFTETDAPTVVCPGCERPLRIEPHLSRHHAAYLGLAAVEPGR